MFVILTISQIVNSKMIGNVLVVRKCYQCLRYSHLCDGFGGLSQAELVAGTGTGTRHK